MPRLRRLLLAAIGIALLGYFAWDAGRRSLEDWRIQGLRQQLQNWRAGASTPSYAHWSNTVDALRAAQRERPGDPDVWENLGLVYEIGSRKFVPDGTWNVLAEFSLLHYRRAAALRPTSPYAWGGVVVMKYRLGQVDGEFTAALVNAMQYGPWEPGVQLMAADLGLALWDRMNVSLRELMAENFRRTAVRQADQLARQATLQGKQRILCDLSLDSLKSRLKCAD